MKHVIPALCLTLSVPTLAQESEEKAPPVSVRGEGAFEGYNLYTQLRGRDTFLVDMNGNEVHRWSSDLPPGNSAYLLENGNLLRACRVQSEKFSGGGIGGGVELLDWDSNVLWKASFADDSMWHHHDIAPMPDGNVLVLIWKSITREQAMEAGRDPEALADESFWPDSLLEVKPVGEDGYEIVWEWHTYDHLIQDFNPEGKFYGDVTAHPERVDINAEHRNEPPLSAEQRRALEEQEAQMRALGYIGGDEEEEEEEASSSERGGRDRRPGDWMHGNGVDYDPVHDLIVLSVRSFSEFWIIDHSTTTEEAASRSGGRYGRGGDLLYRWGNPRMYGRGKRSDQRLWVQHDSKFVHTDDGLAVSVFNNGSNRSDESYSTVDIVHLPFDAERGFTIEEGEAFGPRDATWTYGEEDSQRFYASFISGAQVLPNGNVMFCEGPLGRLTEVTHEGEIVWQFTNPFVPAEASEGREDPPEGARGPGEGRRGPGGRGPGGRGQGDRGPGERGTGERDPGDRGDRGPRGDEPRRRGGGPNMNPGALFRGTRLSPDHPGLSRLGG